MVNKARAKMGPIKGDLFYMPSDHMVIIDEDAAVRRVRSPRGL